MWAWKPVLTPGVLIASLLAIGTLFVVLGIVAMAANREVHEQRLRYDNLPNCTALRPCTLEFEMKEYVRGPLFVYYELRHFYQNHRDYCMSRSDNQLSGQHQDTVSPACVPMQHAPDGRIYNPCGLIAQSFFNGTCTTPPPLRPRSRAEQPAPLRRAAP